MPVFSKTIFIHHYASLYPLWSLCQPTTTTAGNMLTGTSSVAGQHLWVDHQLLRRWKMEEFCQNLIGWASGRCKEVAWIAVLRLLLALVSGGSSSGGSSRSSQCWVALCNCSFLIRFMSMSFCLECMVWEMGAQMRALDCLSRSDVNYSILL